MKISEANIVPDEEEVVVVCGEVEEDDDTIYYDEDDFSNALDLLETARKSLEHIVKYGMTPGRRELIENQIRDIDSFVGTFVMEVTA
jgi:hypothetical protein